jgi:hypothetical protein
METTEKKIATKQPVLKDVRVVCDPPSGVGKWCRSEEARARELKEWADDFNGFIRDHRSQDGMHISIERVVEDCCSACGASWETMDGDGEAGYELGKQYCAHCGTECG